MAEYPKRKRIRLADYDYGSPGAYFVTVCTHEKRCVFSRISVGEGLAPPVVQLTEIGAIVEGQILDLARRYPALVIDRFVIMPNHVHLLITLTGSQTAGGAYPQGTGAPPLRFLISSVHSNHFPCGGRSPCCPALRSGSDRFTITSSGIRRIIE